MCVGLFFVSVFFFLRARVRVLLFRAYEIVMMVRDFDNGHGCLSLRTFFCTFVRGVFFFVNAIFA